MWFFYAVLAALTQSGTRVANQFFKHDGINLTFAIKVFQTLYAVPFLFFVTWPESPWFYVFTLITAPLVVYQDKSFFDFTSKFGAGPVTRIEPLSVPFVFAAWLLFHPVLLCEKIETPLLFSGIGLCLIASTFFALRMRRCPINGPAISAMLPLVAVAGTINLLAKAGVDFMPKDSGIAVYVFLQSLFVAVLSFGWGSYRISSSAANVIDKRLLWTSFGLSLLILCVMVLRLLAFKGTENPAYVTAIMLTGPFWTLLINKMLGYDEKGEIVDGLGIVLSVLALTVLTTL